MWDNKTGRKWRDQIITPSHTQRSFLGKNKQQASNSFIFPVLLSKLTCICMYKISMAPSGATTYKVFLFPNQQKHPINNAPKLCSNTYTPLHLFPKESKSWPGSWIQQAVIGGPEKSAGLQEAVQKTTLYPHSTLASLPRSQGTWRSRS